MGVTYAAAFDVNAIRDGLTGTDYAFAMTVTGAGSGFGYTPVTIGPADFVTYGTGASVYAHDVDGYAFGSAVNHEDVPMFADYGTEAFAQAIVTVLNAKMLVVASPWTGDFSVSYADNGAITFSRNSGTFTFTIQWGSAASRFLLGFSADANSADTTQASDITPTYWISAVHDGRSMDREGDYEPDGIAALSISDSATHHSGVARSTSPKFRAWFQHHQPVATVLKSRIAGTVRWTFEHLFEHCRCTHPFIVYDGVERMVCVFTAEGAVFANKQRSGSQSDDVHMHVPFNVWHAGSIPSGG